MPTLRKICLIGFDRLIGSLALGLKRSGFRGAIVGVDDPDVIAKCWKLGIVTDGTQDLSKALVGAELAIMSSHSSYKGSPLSQILELADDGAIISEMTRVKGDVNRVFEESSRKDIHYVGFRLLSESDADKDVDNSNRFFFEGKSVILTPRGKDDLDAYLTLSELLKKMGATVVAMSPQAHDHLLALHSQIPRVTSLALLRRIFESTDGVQLTPEMLNSRLVDELRDLAGGRHLTWLEDIEANKDLVTAGIDEFIAQMQKIKAGIRAGSIKTEFEDLTAHANRLLGAVPKSSSNELVFAAGSDSKVLERIAELFAKQRLPLGKLEKMENAEAGTYRLTMRTPEERERAVQLLDRAGIEVVDLSE